MNKKALTLFAALAVLGSSAQALPTEQNWMIGRWKCAIAADRLTMSWAYPIVACDGNCTGSVNTKPVGSMLTGAKKNPLKYISGTGTTFSFVFASDPGFVFNMTKIDQNTMYGPYQNGEQPVALRCARDTSLKFNPSITGGAF